MFDLQELWEKTPGLRDAMLNSVTRDGTISEVEILEERANDSRDGRTTVRYVIRYKGAPARVITDYCILQLGRWRLRFADTVRSTAPDFFVWDAKNSKNVYLAVAASKLQIQETYTRVPGSSVSIRLPEDCQWDADSRGIVHKDLPFEVRAYERSEGIESALKTARSGWGGWERVVETSPAKEKDVVVMGRNAKLLSGDAVVVNGDKWRIMVLVLGTETQNVIIEGRTPPVEGMVRLLEESLMTIKWEP
jgi:hypothetical protein